MSDWLKFLLGAVLVCLALAALFIGIAYAIPYLYEQLGWH